MRKGTVHFCASVMQTTRHLRPADTLTNTERHAQQAANLLLQLLLQVERQVWARLRRTAETDTPNALPLERAASKT